MEIFRIVGMGIIGAVSYVLLRDSKPEIAIIINIVCGCVILMTVANYLSNILSVLSQLVLKTGINSEVLSSIIKIIGVGYVTEFGASICEDAGSKSISDKLLFGGKVVIMFLSLPIITALIELIGTMLT